jgi:predicted ArsR family transcriptional regulator
MKSQKTTKDQLLVLIKKRAGITFEAIKESFTISEPAIRKHLSEMEKQGLIMKKKQKQKIGRPFFTYDLTGKGHGLFPNQYESLPVEILEDLEDLQGSQAVEALLNKRMDREVQELQNGLTSAVDFEEKIEKLVELQNKSGYLVDVEKTPEGHFILTNYNCPIANIAFKYQQVCSNEKTVYSRVFKESTVIPETLITKGEHACKWIIKVPESSRIKD